MLHDTLFTNPTSTHQQVFRQLRIPHPPNKKTLPFFDSFVLLLLSNYNDVIF